MKTLINDGLLISEKAITYQISQQLSDLLAGRALVQGNEGMFDVEPFAREGHCTFSYKEGVHNEILTTWQSPELTAESCSGDCTGESADKPELYDVARNAWLIVEWKGQSFEIVTMHWPKSSGWGEEAYTFWILAPTRPAADDLIKAVCRFNAEVRGEILVFNGSCFQKDASLMDAIKSASFDNLVLKGTLKEEIRTDLENYFTAQELYKTYNLPWKRGILLVGPPGNGKTHTIKAIVNSVQTLYNNRPCIYVKTFKPDWGSDQANIAKVFSRARRTAPCLLVLEDLDSLLTDENRSFFLNELDGFATNEGIVTIASTNHPEKLDVAILERPSRFDRKYQFDIPGPMERLAYIQMWSKKLKIGAEISEEVIEKLSGESTEGFSFAYLKELFLSALMRWISKRSDGNGTDLSEVLIEQAVVLAEQVKQSEEKRKEEEEKEKKEKEEAKEKEKEKEGKEDNKKEKEKEEEKEKEKEKEKEEEEKEIADK